MDGNLSSIENYMNQPQPTDTDYFIKSLEWAYTEIQILQKQIPLKNSYNCATENGKAAWEAHNNGMCEIEKVLAVYTNCKLFTETEVREKIKAAIEQYKYECNTTI